jgi:hypothetical protein
MGMNRTQYSIIFSTASHQLNANSNRTLYPMVKTDNETIYEIMNGVSGFAGLHSSVNDLAVFAQMMLQKGYYDDTQFIDAKNVLSWNSFIWNGIENYNGGNSKGLNFIDPGGCSLKIDLENKSFIIVLAHTDVHNPSNKNFKKFMNDFHQQVYEKLYERN